MDEPLAHLDRALDVLEAIPQVFLERVRQSYYYILSTTFYTHIIKFITCTESLEKRRNGFRK